MVFIRYFFFSVLPPPAGNPTNEATARYPTIRDAVMKIRFLTLTPQQFAEGPAASNLLTQAEKFAILMNISSPSTDVVMPAGFNTSTVPRQRTHNRSYELYPTVSWFLNVKFARKMFKNF